jgi:hypothetical protein
MSDTQPKPTPTAARVRHDSSAHYYRLDGSPCHEVQKADKSGMTKTTLAHARKFNLLPSVTTILRLLDKPQLNAWKTEQAVLAVLTAKRLPDEGDDAFVARVLHEEEQQDQEAKIAREKGTALHDGLMLYFGGEAYPEELKPWLEPVINALLAFGERASSEIVLVGDDYAGCTDLIQDCEGCWRIWDYKSAKNLPDRNKGAWEEHQLQVSAYAKSYQNKLKRAGAQLKPIIPGIIYISTTAQGQYVIFEVENWEDTYARGFAPLISHWQWKNNYRPENPNRVPEAAATSVEVENMRQHYIEANERTAKLEQELKDKLAALDVEYLPKDLPPAQGSPELAALRARLEALEAAQKPAAPAQPLHPAMPVTIPKPAPVSTAPPLPTPKTVPPGKKVVWSSGTPTTTPVEAPQPMPLQ